MYIDKSHSNMPHVVKFSGGRSSGYMVLKLIEKGLLDKKRGDVVIFNNTSAEHPKTYEFVKRIKKEVESADIPFFILEFQTFEDMKNGIYDRYRSYRIVNEEEFSKKNPFGYKKNMEIFEEFISFLGYTPSFYSGRICSKYLKKDVTEEFIKDWLDFLKFGINIQRKGHYRNKVMVDFKKVYKKHEKSGGKVPFEIFKRKKEYCYLKSPLVREAQNFQDFTNVELKRVDYNGNEVVLLIGFRKDEGYRLKRIEDRLNLNEKIEYYVKEEKEHIYMPLVFWNVTKDEIFSFWDKFKFDLELPRDGIYGNCVYCFMKGLEKLKRIKPSKETKALDIDFWVEMEKKYQRNLIEEKRNRKKDVEIINFFGVEKEMSYEVVREHIYSNFK